MAIDLSFLVGNATLYDIVLPFLLIFAIVFATLSATKILGGNKGAQVIVSIVLGLLLVRNQVIVSIINEFLPNVSLAIIVILMTLLVIGLVLGHGYEWADGVKTLAAIFSVIVVLWIFFGTTLERNFGVTNFFENLSPETKGILVFVLGLIVVVWYVTREEKKGGEGLKGLFKNLEGVLTEKK
ncbi:hypothetical protein HYV88_04650 [Candidatus Woesearchaeota archaeon]|nr:hypothetical protein [Candidatus Woesearchaeota archaeon]